MPKQKTAPRKKVGFRKIQPPPFPPDTPIEILRAAVKKAIAIREKRARA